MSASKAPLEVFWPVERGRVKGAVFSRGGTSAAVTFGELDAVMRLGQWPHPPSLVDKPVMLDRKPR